MDPLKALTDFCVDNPRLDELEFLLGEFNLFEAAGLTHQEIRHSRFLSFLLDPQGAHRMGDLFATRFLQAAVHERAPDEVGVTSLDLELMDLGDLQVACEVQRIDVLMLSESNRFAVVVENKVESSEHSNQLPRYLDAVGKMRPGWRVLPVLLSRQGVKPSDDRYFPVSYESVATILRSVIESRRTSLSPDIALALDHYERLLRRHVVTDAKLTELCQQIVAKHRKALELLMEHMDSPRAMARGFVDGLLADLGWTKLSLFRMPADWKSVVPPGSDGNPIVLFWVDYGLKNLAMIVEIQPGEQNVRQRLFDAAKANPSVFNTKQKAVGTKYGRILRYDLGVPSAPVEGDVETWEGQVREGVERFRDDVLPKVRAVLIAATGTPKEEI